MDVWKCEGSVEYMRELYNKGYTIAAIADELSKKYNVNVTKNGVTGKLNRIRNKKSDDSNTDVDRRKFDARVAELPKVGNTIVVPTAIVTEKKKAPTGVKVPDFSNVSTVRRGMSRKDITRLNVLSRMALKANRAPDVAKSIDDLFGPRINPRGLLAEPSVGRESCKWVYGDPRSGYTYCCRATDTTIEGYYTYCGYHLAMSLSSSWRNTIKAARSAPVEATGLSGIAFVKDRDDYLSEKGMKNA